MTNTAFDWQIDEFMVSKSVETYIAQVAEMKELEFQCGAENVQLIFKLRDFVKKSIE